MIDIEELYEEVKKELTFEEKLELDKSWHMLLTVIEVAIYHYLVDKKGAENVSRDLR